MASVFYFRFKLGYSVNGKELNQPWFNHSDIANGGKLVLKMGDKANKARGSDLKNVPPSAKSL